MRENLIKHVLKRGQIDKARKIGHRESKRERKRGREKRGSEQKRSKESRRQVKWRIK